MEEVLQPKLCHFHFVLPNTRHQLIINYKICRNTLEFPQQRFAVSTEKNHAGEAQVKLNRFQQDLFNDKDRENAHNWFKTLKDM